MKRELVFLIWFKIDVDSNEELKKHFSDCAAIYTDAFCRFRWNANSFSDAAEIYTDACSDAAGICTNVYADSAEIYTDAFVRFRCNLFRCICPTPLKSTPMHFPLPL